MSSGHLQGGSVPVYSWKTRGQVLLLHLPEKWGVSGNTGLKACSVLYPWISWLWGRHPSLPEATKGAALQWWQCGSQSAPAWYFLMRKPGSHVTIIGSQKLMGESLSLKTTSKSEVTSTTLTLSEKGGSVEQQQKFKWKTQPWGAFFQVKNTTNVKTGCPRAPGKFPELSRAASLASNVDTSKGSSCDPAVTQMPYGEEKNSDAPSRQAGRKPSQELRGWQHQASQATSLPVPFDFLAFMSPCLMLLTFFFLNNGSHK